MKKNILFLLVLASILVISGCPGNGGGGGGTKPTVTVKVCSLSGLLPSRYCQVIEDRKFEKGKEPTTICADHKYTGPVLTALAGDLMSGSGDIRMFAHTCANTGIKYVRFFALYTQPWRGTNPFQPYVMYRTWKAGYPADSTPELPFFDLEQENIEWWNRLRGVLNIFREEGVGAIISLETCPAEGYEKYYHPFLSSKQKRNPDNPGQDSYLTDGLWGDPSKPIHKTLCGWHKHFAERIIEEAKKSGVDFMIETGNELYWQGRTVEFAVNWHQWFVGVIEAAGVPKERISVSLIQGNVRDAISAQVGAYWYHGAVIPSAITDETWIDHARLYWSGDGGYNGSGQVDAKGRHGLGDDDAPPLARRIVDLGYPVYEYMSRKMWFLNNDSLNLDDFNPTPAAIVANTWGWKGR